MKTFADYANETTNDCTCIFSDK